MREEWITREAWERDIYPGVGSASLEDWILKQVQKSRGDTWAFTYTQRRLSNRRQREMTFSLEWVRVHLPSIPFPLTGNPGPKKLWPQKIERWDILSVGKKEVQWELQARWKCWNLGGWLGKISVFISTACWVASWSPVESRFQKVKRESKRAWKKGKATYDADDDDDTWGNEVR